MTFKKIIKSSGILIKNFEKPSCINCIHFKPEYISNTGINSNNEIYITISLCKKFGNKNIISGIIDYETALVARRDENMCGDNAKHFHSNSNNVIKD